MLIAALTWTGCEDDEDDNIKLSNSNKNLEVYAVVNNSVETTMQVKSSWTAKSDAAWLDVSPAKGEAGDNVTLTLTATQTNRSKATRTAKVTIKSGDDRYYYTCGELPQTAAQHIKANSWSYGKRLPHNPYVGQLAFV